MPTKAGLAAMMIAALTSAAVPVVAAAQEDDLDVPRRHEGTTALSPRPGTVDTTVPGEGLPQDEVDARMGWLLLTYISAVRSGLRRGNPQRTQDEMAQTRSALAALEQRLASGAHRLVLPADLAAAVATAADALTHGDLVAADRALAVGEHGLHAALANLDVELYSKPGASR
ncbi:MAG TPA: hypothetical protein VMB81_08945 [Candidatus Sulfotelmatobacter sp.]|nr:hypothetical protein [Candidatus Sulfotelmatobacter sp.]